MRLSHYAVGRDNNFTLIRLAAAMTVLFAHSIGALGLPPDTEPVFRRVGFSLGEMGLDALFVTSGFLVTASLANRGDLVSFFWARALRVYPGLWVMLVLTVFVLAPALTTLPLARLLRLRHDLDLLRQMRNADRRHSLFAARRVRRPAAQGRVQRLALDHAGRSQDVHLRRCALDRLRAPARLAHKGDAVRLSGGRRPVLGDRPARRAFRRARSTAPISACSCTSTDRRSFCGATASRWAPASSLRSLRRWSLASFDRTVFLIVYLLVMAPFVLHLAYVPGGRIRRFNELGDYSYGVYIYAFPIQQTLALLFPAMTLAAMMASSAAVSIAVAIVSWKLIEERALQPQGRLRRRDQAAVQLRPRQDRHGGALTSAPLRASRRLR